MPLWYPDVGERFVAKTRAQLAKKFMDMCAQFTLVMTALTLGCLSWHAVTSVKRIHDMKERHLRIEELRGRIVYLDEVLTMSARMSAAT